MHGVTTNIKQQIKTMLLLIFLLLLIINNNSWAVTVTELIEPIKHLKTEIFGGWMTVVKICAAASGIVLSVFRGSLVPFGIGAGLAAGIHLYDGYLGEGVAGALI
jgi:predicted RND superfamily exporter protein